MCIKGDVQIANWKSDEQKKKEIHDPDWNPVKVHVVVVLICSLQAITKAFDGKRKTEEKTVFYCFSEDSTLVYLDFSKRSTEIALQQLQDHLNLLPLPGTRMTVNEITITIFDNI